MNLKEEIRGTLLEQRKVKLNESFDILNDIRDVNFIVEKYIEISSKLIEEGYSIEEIENTDVKNKLDSIDWSEAMKQGALSAVREYAIRYVLTTIFGDNKNFNTIAAKILADLNPIDLIRIFKNEENCNKFLPNVVNSLLELLIRKFGSDMFGVDSNSYDLNPFKGGFRDIITNYSGNISGELVRKTDIAQKISNKFCKVIH
jgi:hypothetical protein